MDASRLFVDDAAAAVMAAAAAAAADARSFLVPLDDLAAAASSSSSSPPPPPQQQQQQQQLRHTFQPSPFHLPPDLDLDLPSVVVVDDIPQPPTMHPNLVSTLKSFIICSLPPPPPPSSSSSSSSASSSSIADLPPDLLSLPDPPPPLSFHDLQPLFPTPPSSLPPHLPSPAAIVPVDLIQNRRPFQCAFPGCNKTFKNPQTLKMHRKTHYSEDSAYRKGNHSLATFPPSCKAGHNKKIPSKCPICKRTFVGLYELRRHFGRKHSEGEKSHGCRKCGKKFYIEVDLRDHEKLCGEPLECKCGMKFAFKCNLVAHKKTHPDCQDSCDEAGSGGGGDHTSSNIVRSKSKPSSGEADLQAPASLNILPFSPPPATCALGANFPLHSMSHNTFLIPFPKESGSVPGSLYLNPDVKSEDVAFPWFTSAMLGVGPMV